MASSSNSKGNSLRWTEAELNLFAEVLADESSQFCTSLERLALKKAANNELFEHILVEVNKKMNDEFMESNKSTKGKHIQKLELNIDLSWRFLALRIRL